MTQERWGGLLSLICGVLSLAALTACAIRPPPVVEYQVLAPAKSALSRIAVIPFVPSERLQASGSDPAASAAQVQVFVAAELATQGVPMIPASDLATAFAAAGDERPDPRTAAEIASRKFGATSVLLGQVNRFRERVGGPRGATGPASVSFRVSLHAAPSGKRLWIGRFDETQVPLSAAPGRARRYPGGGSRWLTAQELARFGVRHTVEALLQGP